MLSQKSTGPVPPRHGCLRLEALAASFCTLVQSTSNIFIYFLQRQLTSFHHLPHPHPLLLHPRCSGLRPLALQRPSSATPSMFNDFSYNAYHCNVGEERRGEEMLCPSTISRNWKSSFTCTNNSTLPTSTASIATRAYKGMSSPSRCSPRPVHSALMTIHKYFFSQLIRPC